MKDKLQRPASFRSMALQRLLNGGQESCDRVERNATAAIKRTEWSRARWLLRLRLQMRPRPLLDLVQRIERILKLIDSAEAQDREAEVVGLAVDHSDRP